MKLKVKTIKKHPLRTVRHLPLPSVCVRGGAELSVSGGRRQRQGVVYLWLDYRQHRHSDSAPAVPALRRAVCQPASVWLQREVHFHRQRTRRGNRLRLLWREVYGPRADDGVVEC